MSTHFLEIEVPLQASIAALEQAIATALQAHGEPLRWAITAVDAVQQIARVEAVVTVSGDS